MRRLRGDADFAPRVRLLVDCDNTLGVSRHEIDDGLALLMLLALDHRTVGAVGPVQLLGVTTTFGNGPEPTVYDRTSTLLRLAGRPDIPVVRGARHSRDRGTDAAQFICRAAREHPGELVVLSLGPVTNLASALEIDPSVAGKLRHVFLMGGYLRPLRFPRREVAELNLSSDHESAVAVLNAGCPVTLASAQLCLQARYGLRHLASEIMHSPRLAGIIAEWFAAFSVHTGAPGFYLWDLVPAMAMLTPRRFVHHTVAITSTEQDLASGTLRFREAAGEDMRTPGVIDLPSRISGRFRFAGDCASLWRRPRISGNLRG